MKLRLGGLQALIDKAKQPVIIGRNYALIAYSVQREIPNDYEIVIGSGARAARFHMPTVHRVEVSIPFSGAMYDTLSEWMWSQERATVVLQPVDYSTSFLVTGAMIEQIHTESQFDDSLLKASINLTMVYSTWSFTQ